MPLPKIILAGGSGFIGSSLAAVLEGHGYDVAVLTRSARGDATTRQIQWDAQNPGPWTAELEGAAAVVNLVGRSVDCRKTAKNRREILESRVNSVRALAAAFRRCRNPPPVWIQSGTLHIHGDTADEILDESSPVGEGFAPMVGTAWEKAFNEADLPGTRRVLLRISFVLGRNGGALKTLARLTRLFLGGTVGGGRQYVSWIHEHDLDQIILGAIRRADMEGVYSVTAPGPVTNREFMRELRRALHRPWAPPTPTPLVRVASFFLRTDPELATLGRRCVPTRLLREGFRFKFAELAEALEDLLGRESRMTKPEIRIKSE